LKELPDPDSEVSILHFHAPVESLLDEALARLKHQTQYAQPLCDGGQKAKELEHWLTCARECIEVLARPEALYYPLHTSSDRDIVCIEEKLFLNDPRLAKELVAGGRLSAYLLTLGYRQEEAFERVSRDYMIHHIQTDLGREMLFALGRLAHKRAISAAPDRRLRRISVLLQGKPNKRKLWDAASVQALLGIFGAKNPGVAVTDTGCFQPLNSLLGLMVAN
jgi:hypothetical protein